MLQTILNENNLAFNLIFYNLDLHFVNNAFMLLLLQQSQQPWGEGVRTDWKIIEVRWPFYNEEAGDIFVAEKIDLCFSRFASSNVFS